MDKKGKPLLQSPTILEIHADAIAHNFRFFRQLLQPKTKIMAMIKASAYGNGAIEIGQLIQRNKLAEYIAVAYVAEGAALREAGVELPIMVLNPHPENFNALVTHCLEPEIHDLEHLEAFNTFLTKENMNESAYPVHLKINTGMNRLGIDPNHSSECVNTLSKCNAVRIKSIMTHLSASGTAEEDEYSLDQLQSFESFYQKIKPSLPEEVFLHALNSNGIYRFPKYHYDMVRLGIGMYGASALVHLKEKLRPICVFKTKVTQVLSLQKGDTIGYSRAGEMSKDGKIATLSVGYADGFSRTLGNGNWQVEINGKLYPTIGNVCMDLCMLDIGNDKVKAGDTVILFGGKKSIHDYAEALETISYEAMCRIGERVERIMV